MDAARGGTLGPRTCMLPFLNPTLNVVVFCHCWNNVDASSLLYEPPYTEPYVRWCGRTAEVTPPPTRFLSRSEEAVKGGANCFGFAEFIGAQRRPLTADAAKARYRSLLGSVKVLERKLDGTDS